MSKQSYGAAWRTLAVALLLTLASTTYGMAQGRLYLVSTGTGDLDNMTLRAHKTIKEADIIFTMRGDRGRFEALLEGKEVYAAGHRLFALDNEDAKLSPEKAAELNKQRESVRKVIRDAFKAGKTIAILDNGDPTIFGPQISFITEFADLDLSIIPGISSFNAANAALKQSLVGGRDGGRSITLAGAPRPKGTPQGKVGAGDPRDGLVFFTMRSDFSQTVAELCKRYPKDTPIAIVMHAGDSAKQRVLRGTLTDIVGKLGGEKLPFEHLIYVGSFLK